MYPVLDTMFYLSCEPVENSPGDKNGRVEERHELSL